MEYEIVDLSDFSGAGCTVYTVILEGDTESLFDIFIKENLKEHKEEVRKLIANLKDIGSEIGMRENFYKPNEGGLGDQIGAMYVNSGPGLRLYFIKYGSDVILLGGGGYKGSEVRALQDDPKLNEENQLLRQISKHIGDRLINKDDLWWSDDRRYIEGDLKNYESDNKDS